jgi:hypothetical protein
MTADITYLKFQYDYIYIKMTDRQPNNYERMLQARISRLVDRSGPLIVRYNELDRLLGIHEIPPRGREQLRLERAGILNEMRTVKIAMEDVKSAMEDLVLRRGEDSTPDPQ